LLQVEDLFDFTKAGIVLYATMKMQSNITKKNGCYKKSDET